jgi:uncharacterized NAD-dependent epimerase/dehydratase family protein
VYRLTSDNKIALLMHGALGTGNGKMGSGLLRYSEAPVVVVIDRDAARTGKSVREITGIPSDAPIVSTVAEAVALGPDVLVPAIAPSGGRLPQEWVTEVQEALSAGLSLANGLHTPMASDPALAELVKKPGQFIWDIRQEPSGLHTASGLARETKARRVLFVGTDMGNGKMTASLELTKSLKEAGFKARFLATGQIGIAIAGEGIPLDAVRVDYAAGSIEQMVVKYGEDHDILLVEGQGSLFHPASTATLSLLRGAMPSHLILVHEAGLKYPSRYPWAQFPSLTEVIKLYEMVSTAAGAFPESKVVAIALNTAHLNDAEAAAAVEEAKAETGLPVTDVIRYGTSPLVEAVRTR